MSWLHTASKAFRQGVKCVYIRLASMPRQRYVWVVGVLLGLGMLLYAVTMVTPYRDSQRSYTFYSPDMQATTYYRAEVVSYDGKRAEVRILDGGSRMVGVDVATDGSLYGSNVNVGDTVMVAEYAPDEPLSYVDKYRVPGLLLLLIVFAGVVILVGGKRGMASLVGLLASILVIGWGVIPLIIAGYEAFAVLLGGAIIIAIVSVLLAHGVHRRTLLSIACIVAILLGIGLLSWIMTQTLALTGIATEDAFYVAYDQVQIDMRGVLASGIVIAGLGVLDDVVTTQVATVEQLHIANKKRTKRQLYKSATVVGGEHIASLVNTLALAYVGASLPMIILLMTTMQGSFVALLNSEYIATEVARTVIVSIGLVVAVPISTYVASWYFKRSV